MTMQALITMGTNDGHAHQYKGTALSTLPEHSVNGEFMSDRDLYDAGYDKGVIERSVIAHANA